MEFTVKLAKMLHTISIKSNSIGIIQLLAQVGPRIKGKNSNKLLILIIYFNQFYNFFIILILL